MAFDRDFAPEPIIPETEIDEEHREMVAISETISDLLESLRLDHYSPEEFGRLVKQEIVALGGMAEERVRERHDDEGCCA